jgi:hypothetical protein
MEICTLNHVFTKGYAVCVCVCVRARARACVCVCVCVCRISLLTWTLLYTRLVLCMYVRTYVSGPGFIRPLHCALHDLLCLHKTRGRTYSSLTSLKWCRYISETIRPNCRVLWLQIVTVTPLNNFILEKRHTHTHTHCFNSKFNTRISELIKNFCSHNCYQHIRKPSRKLLFHYVTIATLLVNVITDQAGATFML